MPTTFKQRTSFVMTICFDIVQDFPIEAPQEAVIASFDQAKLTIERETISAMCSDKQNGYGNDIKVIITKLPIIHS